MATNWANKFHDKWYVRIDGKGNPVYGSLIPRPYNPSKGNQRFIEVIIPNQICCTIPASTVELPDDDFVLGGQIQFTIANSTGELLDITVDNSTTHTLSLAALVTYLTTNYPGYGTFSVSGDVISLQSPDETIVITAEYLPAIAATIDPSGFAAATNVDFEATGAIPLISTVKGASLADTLTTIAGTLNADYSSFGTWVATATSIRLDDRQITPLTIALTYS